MKGFFIFKDNVSRIAAYAFLIAVFSLMGGVKSHAQEYEFVLGEESGAWHYFDTNWTRGKGKSGWSSAQKGGTEGPSIALVSTPNVWYENKTSDSGQYPMRVFLTNLSAITGPNIHVYNGYVITKVEVKLRNAYRSNNRKKTNSMTLWLGGTKEVTVTNGYDIPSGGNVTTATFGMDQTGDNYLEPTAHLSVSFERSALTNFARTFNDETLIDEDIFADLMLKLTVKKVSQQVTYTIYDYDPVSGAKEKKVRPEVSEGSPNRYFTETVDGYVGAEPNVPESLKRWGCEYGFNVSAIGYNPDAPYPVEVFFKVHYTDTDAEADNEHLAFYFSKSATPEYRYFLQSATMNVIGQDPESSESSPWKFYESTYANVDNISTMSFIGDPYAFRFTMYNNSRNAWTSIVAPMDDVQYSYFDLYGPNIYEPSLSAEQKTWANQAVSFLIQYDPTVHPGLAEKTFYSYTRDYTKYNRRYRTVSRKRTRTRTRSNRYSDWGSYSDWSDWSDWSATGSFTSWEDIGSGTYDAVAQQVELPDISFNDGRLSCVLNPKNYTPTSYQEGDSSTSNSGGYYSTTDTQTETQTGYEIQYDYTIKYSPAGILLRPIRRPANITVNYSVLDQNNSALNFSYSNPSMYNGDPLFLPPTKQRSFYKYEFFNDAAFNNKKETVTSSNWSGNSRNSHPTETVYVRATLDAPFDVTPENASDAESNWYYLKLNGKLLSARGYPPYPLEAEDETELSPMHLWKFVMNSDGTFSLQNRWWGNSYYLTNTSGNYTGENARANFDGYPGASMQPVLSENAKWDLIEVVHPTERENGVFGLRCHNATAMNLSDYQGKNMMRYNDKEADIDGEACFTVVKYNGDSGSTASSVATVLGESKLTEYIKEANTQVGTPFGLARELSATGSLAKKESELVNPANYLSVTDGYCHIRLSQKIGNEETDSHNAQYLQVIANTDEGSTWGSEPDVAVRDVITEHRIRAWLTSENISNTKSMDATDVTFFFRIKDKSTHAVNNHGTRPYAIARLSSEGFPINGTIAVPVARLLQERFGSMFDNCDVTLYPYGLGRCVILVNEFSGIAKNESLGDEFYFDGDTYYRTASPMLVSYKAVAGNQDNKKVLMESAYMLPSPCYIETASDLEVVMTRVTADGPLLTSVNLPFDITLPAEVEAYIAYKIDQESGFCFLKPLDLTATDNVLPANVPVILMSESNGGTALEKRHVRFNLMGTEIDDSYATKIQDQIDENLLVGTNFAFTVPMVNESVADSRDEFTKVAHDAYKGFGMVGDPLKAGFYPLQRTRHLNMPANKAFTHVTSDSDAMLSKGQGLALVFTDASANGEDSETTAITAIVDDPNALTHYDVYDMAGRCVAQGTQLSEIKHKLGKGVYIVNGQKVVFK